MYLEEIKTTEAWMLYEKGQNFHRRKGYYNDTDRNYRFYNGDQWEGANLGDVERVQKNVIRPIVKYKLGVIHGNLYAPKFSSNNFESIAFQQEAEHYTDMLDRYVARAWETDKMDRKLRKVTKDASINGEGIVYVDFDEELKIPRTEVVKKVDVYYGNENNDDIQSQPYILIRKRMDTANAQLFAEKHGYTDIHMIVPDNFVFELSGDDAKEEVEDMVTIVYKMYKLNGTVHFSISTRYAEISKDIDLGIKLYPVAHFNWEDKEGSARGEGEVQNLIPNQIEINKIEMRRAIAVKSQAFPQKVYDETKITNPQAINQIGTAIKTGGQTVDDVNKVITTLQPATMSPDVKMFEDDLISQTRELAGAGDIATGDINPEQASGRSILAVQQATQMPITEQTDNFKMFLEDWSEIALEYIVVYSQDGIQMEKQVDMGNGQKQWASVNVPQSVLEKLKASIRIDITPKTPFDKMAQDQTIENLLQGGLLAVNRIGELEVYAELLDDDSVAPKMKIKEACDLIRAEQQKIAQLNAQGQMMQQRFSQFINEDVDAQASQMAELSMEGGM